MNNKGQSIFSEYVMIFFVVIAAAVAMTTFVQRSFEARIHDEKNFLINAVNSACDANCQQAAGGNSIPYEYEPYYSQMAANQQHYEKDVKGATSGNAEVMGVKYLRAVNEETQTALTSYQLPPICSSPNPPPCCSHNACQECTCLTGGTCGADTCGDTNTCSVSVGGVCVEKWCTCFTGQKCGADSCGDANACGGCNSGYKCNDSGVCVHN